jgi:hypothetical protein
MKGDDADAFIEKTWSTTEMMAIEQYYTRMIMSQS